MKTKEKIIDASIRLFNASGVSKITIRHIAAAIGISHGNLAYHFKNKECILDEIYSTMADEMSQAVYPEGRLTLEHYDRLLAKISSFQRKYGFFYIDMLEIARRHPHIIERYRATIIERSEQLGRLVEYYVAEGYFKPEPTTGYYASLFHSIWAMSTFWLQQEIILGAEHPAISTGGIHQRIWDILLPHLTQKGLDEYRALHQSAYTHDAAPKRGDQLSNVERT